MLILLNDSALTALRYRRLFISVGDHFHYVVTLIIWVRFVISIHIGFVIFVVISSSTTIATIDSAIQVFEH